MRILHTSDWHLGRQFERMPLIDDQRAFVEWLVDTVREDRIDLVAIAGDVYDRSVPPEDAVELLDLAIGCQSLPDVSRFTRATVPTESRSTEKATA